MGRPDAAMTERGHRILAGDAMQNSLIELSDDRHIVIESSANLRSCHNIEHMCIHDRPLLEFHRHG